jgi:Kef-type K+ transport system membrane component KefB
MIEEILASTEFQMSLLLFVALAGYLIAYRINQSAVVGIILAGIIVGPSFLGLVTYTDFVASLAHLGAVVLLFTIGLEFHFKEIAQIKYVVIGLVGIVVPWLGGFWLASLFSFDFNSSVFIGTATTATSIAITAKVLEEMGRLKTKAARAIMGAAIIDDVLALMALSISEQLVSDSLQTMIIIFNGAKAIGFLVLVIFPLRFLLRRFMVWFDKTRTVRAFPEAMFIAAIMVAFLYGMGAEAAGLSAIVGSFLAGVTFSSVWLERGHIFHEGSEHLRIIFASVFFVSLGVLLDINAVDARLLVFVAALTGIAAITKVVGCGLPALLSGFSLRDSTIIGVGMMPRGEVAMIVALVGLSNGWIGQDIYAALILMSLLTTIIPPIMLRSWPYLKGSFV